MLASNQGGAIINIASVQGSQSQVGIPAYASSKGAVLSLTRQMAMDYSSEGIRTCSVSPGTIQTPLLDEVIASDQAKGSTMGLEDYGAMYPRNAIGQPDDIARLCVFLASKSASNITGENINCDGGIAAMGSWDRRVGFKTLK